MTPWSIDAYDINLQSFNEENIDNYLVITKEIRSFLNPDSQKMFIVAPKGLGKSYLLRVKSYLFRKDAKGYKFIPEEQLCERFTNIKTNFSKEELNKFNDLDIWKNVWELSFYTLILKDFKEDFLPKEISSLIGNEGILAEFVALFLQNRNKINKLHDLVATHLKPAVRKLKNFSDVNQVAIFVDGIDEILEHLEKTQSDNTELKASVWVNAQLAALLTAKDICAMNNHIKIFLSIRSEATKYQLGALTLQLEAKIVFLKYSREQIREIFEKNILFTSESELVDPNNTDIIKRLAGFSEIKHKFVINREGPVLENLFDFIYRHTFARPREIIMMGQAILEMELVDRKSQISIGKIVNQTSNKIFSDQLQGEIIPVFDDTLFNCFVRSIDCTVVEHKDKKHIEKEIEIETGVPNSFSYFYNLGLLGGTEKIIDHNGKAKLKQTFLPVGHYSLVKDLMPDYDYYLLHPSINKRMNEVHKSTTFYHKENIIGYDNEFVIRPINTRALEHHIHFGFDRDSIGIILPELQNSKSLCICVDSTTITELKGFENLLLSINNQDYHFKIYNPSFSESVKNEMFEDWKDGKYSIILLSTDNNEILSFYEVVTTISFCKPSPFLESLNYLIDSRPLNKKIFYYCLREFVKEEFNRIEILLKLEGKNKLEPVMIDRFQFSLEKFEAADENLLTFKIQAEIYRKIICRERNGSTLRPSEHVYKITNQETFEYYINRQNLIVEGLYQFIKLLRFKSIKSRRPTLYDNLVLEFINIQVYRVLKGINYDAYEILSKGVTRSQFREDLLKFAKETLERIQKVHEYHIINCDEANLLKTKQKDIFPSQECFYRKIKKSNCFYESSETFLELEKILEIGPLNDFYSVFISYSLKDRKIALPIEQRLSLMGLKVSMYEKDNPTGPLPLYMVEKVTKNDKMLFIASKNSLTSDGCHFELTKCRREIYKNNDVFKLVPIRIDNYVLEVKDEEIKDNERLENIKMLREINVLKYLAFTGDFSLVDLDDELTKLVNECLIKD